MEQQSDWMQPIQRQNLSEMAYARLRAALMTGEVRPGEELPLRPVSQRLGISATPLREALMRLVAERALDLDGRGRISVPHITRSELTEIRRVRAMLEGDAAREAALQRTPSEVAALRAIHDALLVAQDAGDFGEAVSLNTQFHLHLFRIAKLPLALNLVENLWMRCGPILSHLYDGGLPLDRNAHPHLAIIDAIQDGDPDRAQEMLLFDIRHGGSRLIEHCREG